MVDHACVAVVHHGGVAHINFGVGSVEDAVGQLDVVDDRHHGSVAVSGFHVGSVGVVVHVGCGSVPVVVHFGPAGVLLVMVLHVVTHIHHKAGTGVGEGRRPNGSFMILQECILSAEKEQ